MFCCSLCEKSFEFENDIAHNPNSAENTLRYTNREAQVQRHDVDGVQGSLQAGPPLYVHPTQGFRAGQNLECTSNEILVEFWMIYYTNPSYFVDTVESGYVKEIRPPAFET